MNFEEAKTRASALTPEERAALARLLLETLEEPTGLSDEKLSALRLQEAVRRLGAVKRGELAVLTRQDREDLLQEESDRAVTAERRSGGGEATSLETVKAFVSAQPLGLYETAFKALLVNPVGQL